MKKKFEYEKRAGKFNLFYKTKLKLIIKRRRSQKISRTNGHKRKAKKDTAANIITNKLQ